MAKPKWQQVLELIQLEDDTIAIERLEGGGQGYFTAKTNRAIHPSSFRALMERDLLKPIASKIDPRVPVAFEAAA
ncbi:MAG: hypothetical protein NXH88_10045 [Hyphomonas sp.]|nr:hypothetical protein [Hyphomonas sp.]